MKTKLDQLLDQLDELYMERGVQRGIERSRREMLLRLLRKRFGELSDGVVSRVNGAGVAMLDEWADRVLTASTLDEVWDPPPKTMLDQLSVLYMDRGIERGLVRGRRGMLLRLLSARFGGDLTDGAVARVNGADIPTLDEWADRILTASTLDEVWAPPTN